MKRFVDIGGHSVVRGTANWLDDLAHNCGVPSQVDQQPFKSGQEFGCHARAVVLRTDMFELLEYNPQTKQV